MCVHLLFGLMLLGSKYLSYVCQSYKKRGSVTICSFKHPIFKNFLCNSTFIRKCAVFYFETSLN